MTSEPPHAFQIELETRLQAARNAEAEARQDWNRVSNFRLIIAAAGLGLAFWWIRTGDHVWGVAAAAAAILFAMCMVWHHRLRARLDYCQALVTVRTQAIARVHRDWSALPLPEVFDVDPQHPYAFDLDLLGHGSLGQLIATPQTPLGRLQLFQSVLANSSTEVIHFRQDVARDLVGERDWRERLQATGAASKAGEGDPKVFLNWLDEAAKQTGRPVHFVAIGLAVVNLVLIGLVIAGVIAFAWLMPFLLLGIALNFVLPTQLGFDEVRVHARTLRQYRDVLPIVERIPGSSASTATILTELQVVGKPASHLLAMLDRTMALIVPRGSLAWFVLQAVLHWDRIVEFKLIHTARAIGGRARIWIDAIGQVEAVSALASLADLNPDWVFPDIAEPGGTLRSNDLGHPLIPVERMVANDVEVGPAGRVLIVTGSNMAGKSTLLRTIGLNSVLALAGGPVCASQLSVPNQPIWSSVRITDSLEQGVSLYMAELLRLKDIVDAAETSPITYLLDEILHGTSTTERRIAARQVISRLLRTQSIGVVSTHDLELVDEHLSASATCVHLVDQVNDLGDGPAMTFDYKVRPGLAPTSNALRLLKLVGLAEEPTS